MLGGSLLDDPSAVPGKAKLSFAHAMVVEAILVLGDLAAQAVAT